MQTCVRQAKKTKRVSSLEAFLRMEQIKTTWGTSEKIRRAIVGARRQDELANLLFKGEDLFLATSRLPTR